MIKELFCRKKKLFTFLTIIYMVLMVAIGFYQIDKRTITVNVYFEDRIAFWEHEKETVIGEGDDQTSYPIRKKGDKYIYFSINPYDIQHIDSYTMFVGHNHISKVQLIRDGLHVKELQQEEFADGMVIYQDGKVTFSNLFSDMLRSVSGTVLLERFILILIVTGIYIALLFIIISKLWKQNEELALKYEQTFYMYRFLKDIKKYGYYMGYAAKTDLKAEVANSYLNWVWWILEPFCNMMVYTIVFSQILGTSIEQYPVFVFSGLIMWNFFSRVMNYSVKLIRNNKDIVTKVYVPKFILLLSNMILNGIKLALALLVLIVMMFFFHVHVTWRVLCILPMYLILFLFTFGLGMVIMHFGVFVDDLSYAVNILLSMLMFLSGIFYSAEGLKPALKVFITYINPVAALIYNMRKILIYAADIELFPVLIWFAGAGLLCMIGICMVYKNENSYVKVV